MQIKDLVNQYIIESSSGQYDYVKALADFNSRDESTLNFKKGEIVAVVPKRDAYTEKVGVMTMLLSMASILGSTVYCYAVWLPEKGGVGVPVCGQGSGTPYEHA